jgi:uncharacterized protein (TIGR03000 family)
MYSAVLLMALSGAPADVPAWGCRGCHGCWGGGGCHGCWGGRSWGCYGGCSGWGCYGGCSGWGCYGGYSGGGCYGSYGCGGGYVYAGSRVGYYTSVTPYAPVGVVYQPAVGQPLSLSGARPVQAPATLIVSLPADAKLTVDNTPTKESASPRRFVTPPLDQGKTYYYTLKGEIIRDGETLTATKRVTFRAGEEASVSLEFDRGSVAQK